MKPIYSVILILVVSLAAGCLGNTQSAETLLADKVKEGDLVSVHYAGTYLNGTVFDSSINSGPISFTAGAGQMIRGFDSAVIGMSLNEEKIITIQPEDAYGQRDPSLVFEVPIENIPDNTKVGDILYANRMPVKVMLINSTAALIDANHPLAGEVLTFWIKVINITKP